MADPIITAAAITAGSNLLGGALANSKHVDATAGASYWYDRQERYDARKEEYERQKEFAQHGVRWRVKDAVAAGLHPLFAFGGNLAGYSPSASVGGSGGGSYAESDGMGDAIARAGQDVGRAVAAQETVDQRNERQARLALLAAGTEKDLAQASYYRSLAARESNPAAAPFPGNLPQFGADVVTQAYNRPHVESHPLYADAVQLKPDEMVSRDASFDGQTAGRNHPPMRQFQFPGGYNVLLPATGGGGVPEEIDMTMIPLIVGANLQRYGWRWVVDTLNYMTGATPDETRAQDARIMALLKRGLSNWRAAQFR